MKRLENQKAEAKAMSTPAQTDKAPDEQTMHTGNAIQVQSLHPCVSPYLFALFNAHQQAITKLGKHTAVDLAASIIYIQ